MAQGDALLAVCQALSNALPGKLSMPNSDPYTSSLRSYFSLQEGELAPSCVLQPANAQEVAAAVKVLATTPSLKFAVRGGGHTVWAGSANIQNGVTIDMRLINNVEVSADKSYTSVGAGALWRDVYTVLDEQGLATSGGRASQVGVGGGLSFFSARKGFVCDNVLEWEVVLSDGRIVTANAKTNPDLWLALKGGSNNFGIVTRFNLATFEQPRFYGGQVFYNISTVPEQLKAFSEFTVATGYDDYASLIQSYGYTAGQGFGAINGMRYTAAVEAPPKVFQPFLNIQPQLLSTMRVSNVSDFTHEQGQFSPDGFRQLYRVTSFRNDLNFLNDGYKLWESSASKLSNVADVVWSLTYQPIVPAITSKSGPLGGNMLGLDGNTAPFVLCLITGSWSNAADDRLMSSTAVKLIDDIEAGAKRAGIYNEYKYLNYADGSQNVIDGYGSENKQKMQAVSRKYDRKGVFQNQVPGGYKLFAAGEVGGGNETSVPPSTISAVRGEPVPTRGLDSTQALAEPTALPTALASPAPAARHITDGAP
ncbi:MAG: hypothetical protein LQ342_000552 [Letrouitia transgressa]|nr:MAG: hypothetical protein LQ342_000552 [Letrouitia transgressa]